MAAAHSEATLPAVSGLLRLIGVMIRRDAADIDDDAAIRRRTSLIALSTLVGAYPPDPRLPRINQALMIADPELMRSGPLVDTLASWPGGDPNAILDELTAIAMDDARDTFASRPERAIAFRNYLRRFGYADLIGRAG